MSTLLHAVIVATLVSGECTDVLDEEVEGRYLATFDEPVPRRHAAAVALDAFHDTVAVSTLDDFEFSVLDEDGDTLFEDEGGAGTRPSAVGAFIVRQE